MKRKVVIIPIALILIVCLSACLVACTDNNVLGKLFNKGSGNTDGEVGEASNGSGDASEESGGDNGSNDIRNDDMYYLASYVDYENIDFQELTSDAVLEAIANFDLSTISSEASRPCQIEINGNAFYRESDAADAISHSLACLISLGDTFYLNSKIDDATTVVESKNDYYYILYRNNDIPQRYNISQSEFWSDFLLNIYGLTAEEAAEKQQAYYDELEYAKDDSADNSDNATLNLIINIFNGFVKNMIDCDAIDALTAIDNGYKHIKISLNPDNFIDSFRYWLKEGVGIIISGESIIKAFNKLDFCVSLYNNELVCAYADIDISAHIAKIAPYILSTITTILTSTMPPWIEGEPVAIPSKIVEFSNQLYADYCKEAALIQISGKINCKNIKTAHVGTLDSSNTTGISFAELFGEAVPINELKNEI